MASEDTYRVAAAARAAEAAPGVSYVEWGAILAGAVLTVTLSLVLLTFGSAVGLSASSFQPGQGVSLFWFGIASGIWFIWVAITSFGAGGYLAGRLRRLTSRRWPVATIATATCRSARSSGRRTCPH
ncbi:MAG: hypothetical protein QM699_02700 [Amaricoccus sp.]|uniref:hypothetical protein n=1 Tax=Amaricoccus sp. TaxID=1872485 RepID=UPI0039E477F5